MYLAYTLHVRPNTRHPNLFALPLGTFLTRATQGNGGLKPDKLLDCPRASAHKVGPCDAVC